MTALPPTFLGIGAPRSGTTWVHRLLEDHPDVAMATDRKELHYFDREVRNRSWESYLSSFGPGIARGEFTPDYARLPGRVVEGIGRLLPELRLVFVIRNPVDRTMSQLRNFTATRRSDPSAGFMLRREIERRSARARNADVVTIDRWTRVFGPESLFVLTYDELCADPVGWMQRVYRHLGVDDAWVPSSAAVQTHVSVKAGRPDHVADEELLRWYVAKMWLPATRELDRRLDGRVAAWVEDLERTVASPGSRWWEPYRTVRRFVIFPPFDAVYSVRDGWKRERIVRANRGIVRAAG